MKKLLLGLCAAAFALPAAATLMISANLNGTVFTCADQDVTCDTNAILGQLAIANQTINGIEILGSSQFQIIGNNALNTSSFQIINHNLIAALVQVAVSGIDFLGPVSSYSASGSGTWQNAAGSSIDLTFYGDASNTQGANNPTDLPGLLLSSFSHNAVGAADAFAHNASGPFVAGGNFGMSLGTSGTLVAWNGVAGLEPTLVGRSQTILAAPVPEPGTLVLLGLGLLALGFTRRGSLRKS